MTLSFSNCQRSTLYQQPSSEYQHRPNNNNNINNTTPRSLNHANNDWSSSSPPYSINTPPRPSSFNFDFASQYPSQNSHNPHNLRVHVSDHATELMPLDNGDSQMNWSYIQQLTPTYNNNATHHQRASSNSSIGSAGPATPYNNHTSPLVSGADYYDGLPNTEQASFNNLFQKALPTPSNTPLREVFSVGYQNYPHATNSQSEIAAIMALQQPKGFPQESRHDDASGHEEQEQEQRPSMPCRNESSEDFEAGRRKMGYQGQVPKLDRTISDVFADELYSPNFAVTSAPPQTSPTKTSPSQAQTLIQQRLQAANSQHLSAPPQFSMANVPRGSSPFRQGSPLDPSPSFQMSPLSAARMREQEKAEHDAKVLEEQIRKHSPGQDTQQTISPKDALLEYHETEEDANMPLFPQKSPSFHPAPKVEPSQTDDNESLHSFGSMATSRRESSSAYSASSQTTTQPSAAFNFAPPAIPGRAQVPQVPQQYPFVPNQNSLPPAIKTDSNVENSPEFHSSLVSMESSSSDYLPETELKKPANVSSDGGTYTCTYQGCTLRFDTPAKLQKHKKDGHRQTGTGSIAGSSRGSSEGIAARNSQAGPHRCDRINPSTGKPCNTVFSRPYDLTRHEDTIHNARHQKIRCSLCTEVKTFSRNDALTRHFRVVHPEVELPGKARRRHVD